MIFTALTQPQVRQWIKEHENDEPAQLMLQAHRFPGIPVKEAVEQIQARKKARHKLPSWYTRENIIYPPSLSVEQSSSEETAQYKATLISGTNLADLTGGMGVDTFYLSQNFKEAWYVEQQEELCQLAAHNFQALGVPHIKIACSTAETFLDTASLSLDAIYLDPARRGSENQKLFKLADCQPDITALLPRLFQLTNTVLLKAAPMLDISQGLSELEGVAEVHVIAVKNEVKELLFLMHKRFSGEAVIKAVNLLAESQGPFNFTLKEEQIAKVDFSYPLDYLYEPHAAIMKAGAFKLIAQRYELQKLHMNSHLYTSKVPVSGFPGRTFSILYKGKPDKKVFQQFFPDKKALISSRNHPVSVQQLSKKMGLKEGGSRYLFATTFADGKPGVVIGDRIK